MTTVRDVQITPLQPQGGPWRGVWGGLAGDAVPSINGTPWSTVSRPRQKAFIEFTGVGLIQLVLPLIFEAADGADVEASCQRIDTWRYPVSATSPPPVLQVSGPVPQFSTVPLWVLTGLTWGSAIRRHDGIRLQQAMSITLLEYSNLHGDLTSVAQGIQSALRAATQYPTQGQQLYTASQGDTLTSIAARLLGDSTRWVDIAQLNNIRDPRQVPVGTRLMIP